MGMPATEPVELERGMEVEVKSPCNGICTLNDEDVCKGCKRTRAQISRWYVMSNEEKQLIVDSVK